MARIESPAGAGPEISSRGSQSRLSVSVLFVLLAALLFRLVTALTNSAATKERASSGPETPPLVRWAPLDKASSVSGSSGKPVLYDFTAEWCPPCHRLDDEGWGNRDIARLASDLYVPSRVLDREREEGRNPPLVEELRNRYDVQAYPTLVVAAADGREIARFEGWAGPEELKKFLQESKGKPPLAITPAPASPGS
jgi:thiol-disulfide isomerase/thioredoxin